MTNDTCIITLDNTMIGSIFFVQYAKIGRAKLDTVGVIMSATNTKSSSFISLVSVTQAPLMLLQPVVYTGPMYISAIMLDAQNHDGVNKHIKPPITSIQENANTITKYVSCFIFYRDMCVQF